jgi:high-affinity iron transporter
MVGLAQYLEGDYGNALASHDAAEIEEQKGFGDELVAQLKAAGAEGEPYLARAQALQTAIAQGHRAAEVTAMCHELAGAMIHDFQLVQAPRKTPSLEQGRAHFEHACATCHGLTGRADTEVARSLDPVPANFHEPARMAPMTPYKAFNTITFGISGTAMAPFPSLTDEVRWAQAFYLFTLRQPPCDHAPRPAPLSELATSTDEQLAQRYGASEVACLRRVLPVPTTDTLSLAQAGLDQALALYASGDVDGARQAVVAAYLDGVEPVEPKLKARDAQLVGALEQAFTRARLEAQSNEHFESAVAQAKVMVHRAQTGTSASSFWAVFITALLIMLREGFEAVVVVGALLAVLKKMNATAQAKVVHVAWVTALIVGALAFIFGQAFFAGANREWLETLVALVAVGFLLYAALWLNARAHMSRFMGELRGKMTTALGSGNSAGLFFIAFSSVGRESLETALFLEGLAADSRDGATFGALAGLLALLGLIAFIRTVGFRLPVKTLFSASTVMLVVTAVMLLGKGMHGLQELGVLPLAPVRFITVDFLGLYADALSLVPQLVLSLLALGWKALNRPVAKAAMGGDNSVVGRD